MSTATDVTDLDEIRRLFPAKFSSPAIDALEAELTARMLHTIASWLAIDPGLVDEFVEVTR